ncbi:hypothetical protein ACGFY6_32425 [Streptomyces sp. NPDC048387]|uniref:hypothetical protein n=1 Tax=Streptomyces sp. NPDC048387 TaxID=3365542 RepID=UPI00371E2A16
MARAPALSHGELTPGQQQWLFVTFGLNELPRTEGPGAAESIVHRSFTEDTTGVALLLDVARLGGSGWVFTLFYRGERPSAGTVEEHRALFRAAVGRLGLALVEITPAATADEVQVPSSGESESSFGAHWDLPYEDLEHLWRHLGLRGDAPREVKEVKLRELMRTPAWSASPETLRLQAERFLTGE